jgi:hypothetical protein
MYVMPKLHLQTNKATWNLSTLLASILSLTVVATAYAANAADNVKVGSIGDWKWTATPSPAGTYIALTVNTVKEYLIRQ